MKFISKELFETPNLQIDGHTNKVIRGLANVGRGLLRKKIFYIFITNKYIFLLQISEQF